MRRTTLTTTPSRQPGQRSSSSKLKSGNKWMDKGTDISDSLMHCSWLLKIAKRVLNCYCSVQWREQCIKSCPCWQVAVSKNYAVKLNFTGRRPIPNANKPIRNVNVGHRGPCRVPMSLCVAPCWPAIGQPSTALAQFNDNDMARCLQCANFSLAATF